MLATFFFFLVLVSLLLVAGVATNLCLQTQRTFKTPARTHISALHEIIFQ
ncbi:MAG: hypothetical protein JOZ18_20500 [Chloroflexi bacterium]|nr:hypothetical protein [Chloroflexota bacterium]